MQLELKKLLTLASGKLKCSFKEYVQLLAHKFSPKSEHPNFKFV